MTISKSLLPHQLGWLHRVELDKNGIEVWEKPDGTLYAHDPKNGRLILEKLITPIRPQPDSSIDK